jgi:hypothetical protein
MKRFHARGRGRSRRIEKPFFSNLTIVRARRSAPKPRRRPHNGSESQSDRPAPRHQPHLGQPLVRQRGEYGKLLHEDLKIREMLRSAEAGRRRKVIIERPHKKCRVTIHTARPGVVIGKKGADIEKLRKRPREDDDRLGEVHLNIVEIRKPEIDATWSPRTSPSSSSAAWPSAAP